MTLVLALVIPYILTRQWRLSRGQTALAGVASLLVITGVAFHAFTPAGAQPVFTPLPGVSVSPEDERPRGGGPGASAINRPETPFIRSKLTEATVQ